MEGMGSRRMWTFAGALMLLLIVGTLVSQRETAAYDVHKLRDTARLVDPEPRKVNIWMNPSAAPPPTPVPEPPLQKHKYDLDFPRPPRDNQVASGNGLPRVWMRRSFLSE